MATDPLHALLTLQRALERSFESDWLRGSTTGVVLRSEFPGAAVWGRASARCVRRRTFWTGPAHRVEGVPHDG